MEADEWAADALLQLASGDFEETLAITVPTLSLALLAAASDNLRPATELSEAFRSDHPEARIRTANMKRIASRQASGVASTEAMKFLLGMTSWVIDRWAVR
jgi:hypothetical protein